jgi:hypothetical protein
MQVQVQCNSAGKPQVEVIDTNAQQVMFSVQLESESLAAGDESVKVLNGQYEKIDLGAVAMNDFE